MNMKSQQKNLGNLVNFVKDKGEETHKAQSPSRLNLKQAKMRLQQEALMCVTSLTCQSHIFVSYNVNMDLKSKKKTQETWSVLSIGNMVNFVKGKEEETYKTCGPSSSRIILKQVKMRFQPQELKCVTSLTFQSHIFVSCSAKELGIYK